MKTPNTLICVFLLAIGLASCSREITAPRHAIVFGIRDYASVNDLRWTEADAVSMAELLTGQGFDVELRVNSAATKAAIKSAIESLASVPANEMAVFYFSGHGTIQDGIQYIVPYDATITFNNPDNKNTWISTAELASWLGGAGTNKIIVILDTCYSGGFVTSPDALDTLPQKIDGSTEPTFAAAAFSNLGELLALNAKATGAPAPVVISAAGSQEQSWETPTYGHGVFTYFLLDSALKGDSDKDGYVTATEACRYATAAIKAHWNTSSSSDFMPHISGGSRDLVLFRAP